MIVVLSLSILTFFAPPRFFERQDFELDAKVFGDGPAAGEDGDVLEYGLSPVAVPRGRARQAPVAAVFARFVAANDLTSLPGNVVIMSALVGMCDVPVLPASLIAIGLCGTINYLIADSLVFRQDRT